LTAAQENGLYEKFPDRLVALVCVAIFVGLSACAPVRYGESESALMLEDLTATVFSSRLQSRVPAPSRERILYPSQGGQHEADLYRIPGDRPETGILLLPGIAAAGKDERRLVALARTLARVGFTVLVPDIPGFRSFQLSSSDIRYVVDAYKHLSARFQGPHERCGILAISFAVGPAVLAALQPEIRHRVGFIVGVGGYYDLDQVITFVTTGYFRRPGTQTWEQLSPSVHGQVLLMLSNAQRLPNASDRSALSTFALNMLQGRAEEGSLIGGVLHLQPEGQSLLELITNRNPERTPDLIRRLPPPMQADLAALNPAAHDLSGLKARLILLHGRSDNVIPFTESLALADAVPSKQSKLYLIDGLAHVDLRPESQDLPVLMSFIEMILSERQNRSKTR
jgi:pimeloyl-ACP methyl ester carboxylesterase